MGKSKDLTVTNNGETEVTLQDFVVPNKIYAFVDKYRPLDKWQEGCDYFTDYQLRSYFKAVVCPLGDPLTLYLEELSNKGFRMKDDECGEPVIYCMPK